MESSEDQDERVNGRPKNRTGHIPVASSSSLEVASHGKPTSHSMDELLKRDTYPLVSVIVSTLLT